MYPDLHLQPLAGFIGAGSLFCHRDQLHTSNQQHFSTKSALARFCKSHFCKILEFKVLMASFYTNINSLFPLLTASYLFFTSEPRLGTGAQQHFAPNILTCHYLSTAAGRVGGCEALYHQHQPSAEQINRQINRYRGARADCVIYRQMEGRRRIILTHPQSPLSPLHHVMKTNCHIQYSMYNMTMKIVKYEINKNYK